MPVWDNRPRLDRQQTLQGVLTSGVTVWTLSHIDRTIDYGVLSHTAFAADEGKVIHLGNTDGVVVFAPGDYTAGCVIVGRSYNFLIQLTELFLRDQSGNAVQQGTLQIRDLTVFHRNTGAYRIKIASNQDSVLDRIQNFDAPGNDVESSGRQRIWAGGLAPNLTITLENDQPDPTTIASVEAEVDYTSASN